MVSPEPRLKRYSDFLLRTDDSSVTSPAYLLSPQQR